MLYKEVNLYIDYIDYIDVTHEDLVKVMITRLTESSLLGPVYR